MSPLTIDIWSDIACPWCYVGKRRLEAALASFRHPVEIRWRAFELDPKAPRTLDADRSYAERIATKYRIAAPEAQTMIDRMTATAAADGLDFHFERIQPGNTFDAHRLVHLAGEAGKQDAMKERLFLAYLTEGRAIGDRSVLAECAREIGLDEAVVAATLEGDDHADAVRADEQLAQELGITGVPFFVIDRRLAVSGAQPADVLRAALERAWAEHAATDAASEAGPVCGPDGCA